jgi:hypothetical protein
VVLENCCEEMRMGWVDGEVAITPNIRGCSPELLGLEDTNDKSTLTRRYYLRFGTFDDAIDMPVRKVRHENNPITSSRGTSAILLNLFPCVSQKISETTTLD